MSKSGVSGTNGANTVNTKVEKADEDKSILKKTKKYSELFSTNWTYGSL